MYQKKVIKRFNAETTLADLLACKKKDLGPCLDHGKKVRSKFWAPDRPDSELQVAVFFDLYVACRQDHGFITDEHACFQGAQFEIASGGRYSPSFYRSAKKNLPR